MYTHGIFVVFAASLVLAAVSDTAGRGKDQFDYFLLVRQWPGTICSRHAPRPCKVEPTSNVFTIHGLWPQYFSGGWPEECTDEEFDPSLLRHLEKRLDREWPSYYGNNDGFWAHEWTKHGTCAKSVLPDEPAYFGKVLDLNEKFNLTDALESADITPGSEDAIFTSSVVRAIKKYVGAQPVIHCAGGSVYEIWVCIDKDLRPFDCPGSLAKLQQQSNSYCGRKVTLPPIDDRDKKRRSNRRDAISF